MQGFVSPEPRSSAPLLHSGLRLQPSTFAALILTYTRRLTLLKLCPASTLEILQNPARLVLRKIAGRGGRMGSFGRILFAVAVLALIATWAACVSSPTTITVFPVPAN